ncbi:hypothetical protein [Porphyromonas sp.]
MKRPINEEMPAPRRVRTWLSQEDASEARRLRMLFGFKSDHQLFKASVMMAIRLLQEAERRNNDPEDTTIQDTFKVLSEWEAPEFGRRKRKRKTIKREEVVLRKLFDNQAPTISEKETVAEPSNASHYDAPKWYARFVQAHYQELYDKYASRSERLTGDTLAPRDLLHESILRLQSPPSHVTSYEAYERWALSKFGESHPKNSPCDAPQN